MSNFHRHLIEGISERKKYLFSQLKPVFAIREILILFATFFELKFVGLWLIFKFYHELYCEILGYVLKVDVNVEYMLSLFFKSTFVLQFTLIVDRMCKYNNMLAAIKFKNSPNFSREPCQNPNLNVLHITQDRVLFKSQIRK